MKKEFSPCIRLIIVVVCVVLFIIVFSLLMYLNMSLFNITYDAAIGLNLLYFLLSLYILIKYLNHQPKNQKP